jgi:pimeloyl-ACP methyl ester carboxylesterase
MRLFKGSTPPFHDADGKVTPGSLASIEQVQLGGLAQTLILRGQRADAPVLLFLHGGPGTPETAWLNHYNANLEEHFVVVAWEERGGGKSYRPDIPPETMTLEQFVSDGHELTAYLKQRFHQEKIFLVGHSFGSLLGAMLAQRYPQDYAAYIGIGQVADTAASELSCYEWVLATARQKKHAQAIRELEALGAPVDGRYSGGTEAMHKERKWIREFGGAFHGKSAMPTMVRIVLQSPIYTLAEVLNYFKGEKFSIKYLWDTVIDAKLNPQLLDFDLPVYICQGAFDNQTAYPVAKQYFEALRAPKKEFFTFENSAHGTLFEEPEKFLQIMLKILAETKQADQPT